MAIKQRIIDSDNQQLSEESIARLDALKYRAVDYSDIPESSSEELRAERLLAFEKRKKQMFSLRLKISTITW